MKERETQDKTMMIQDKKCAFGELTGYMETPEGQFHANIKITDGTLQEGVPCTIPLIPFDVNKHGIGTTNS